MSRHGENIYKRKDGRWEGRYIKYYHSGKAIYGYVYGKTYKDVSRRLTERKYISSAEERPGLKFGDISAEWLESIKGFVKESTYVKYSHILNAYILKEFKEYYADEITNEAVVDFASGLLKRNDGKTLSPKTVSDILSVFKTIVKYAVNKDIPMNFSIGHINIRQQPKPLRIFTVCEQNILYGYLKKNINLSNLGILLCLFTGIRIGELCALKWNDISLRESTVYINKTMQRLSCIGSEAAGTHITITSPKSYNSIRTIPLPSILMEDLTLLQQPADTYFLTGDKERFVEPRTMQYRFKAVLKACGIDDVNFHTLRHTFATRCIEVGVDIKSLSEILGHSSVSITMNKYVHPTMTEKHRSIDKLSTLFAVN